MKVFNSLDQLQQHAVMRIFTAITKIPRPSSGEQKIGDWVVAFANERSWSVQRDAVGNILVTVPATPGHESLAPICLQTHLDMVCIDEHDTTYGEERFPLALRLDGDWLSATGTTLGADNGVGVAMALTAASEAEHGVLELLFTVQEETGLSGASSLACAITAKALINLDTEDWGELIIGCAGGSRVDLTCLLTFLPVAYGVQTWCLSIDGLPGGHSGLEINKGFANAICLGAEVLRFLNRDIQDFQLVSFMGGVRSNAIPAKASIIFAICCDGADLVNDFRDYLQPLLHRYLQANPEMKVTLTPHAPAKFAVDAAVTQQVLRLMAYLPNGVITMSSVGDIPQTSINLALAKLDAEHSTLALQFMARSSVDADLQKLQQHIEQVCQPFIENAATPLDITMTFAKGYPGWEPQPDSPLVQTITQVWQTFSSEPLKVTAVHAGLECGLLKGKFPDVHMVSFGPDIRGAHSAKERVSISSVDACYRFLQLLLVKLD